MNYAHRAGGRQEITCECRALQYKIQDFSWFSHLALGLHIDIVLSVEAQEDSVLVTRRPGGLFIHLHGNLGSVEERFKITDSCLPQPGV